MLHVLGHSQGNDAYCNMKNEMASEPLDINSATRISRLLDEYPDLEGVLIEIAPAFAKLRNPVLRKTIARVATLEKAAAIAGIPTDTLVARLRLEAGLPVHDYVESGSETSKSESDNTCENIQSTFVEEPQWVEQLLLRETVDADALLEAGEMPLVKVMTHLHVLAEGEMIRILSSFRPEPLIEAVEAQGGLAFTRPRADGSFEVFITHGDRS